MGAEDFLFKAAAAAAAVALPVWLARRKEPLENAGKLLENYNKLVDRLTAQDEGMAILRAQINELNSAAVRHSNDIEKSNNDAADYKTRWEATNAGLDECRASCQAQAAKIRILEAILTRNGWYNPQIQAAVQAELDQPEAPPTVPPAEPPSEKDAP